MYSRVVVPLDGSPLAEAILPFITDIAGPLDLEVVLLRVLVPVPSEVMDGAGAVLLEDVTARTAGAREYLQNLTTELAARGIRCRIDVRRGHPVREILAGAQEADADLVAKSDRSQDDL